MAENKPGGGLFGWLGRQFGYISGAIKKDVTKQVVHREQRVEEAKLPNQPNVTLRRTVIDEVIVDKKPIENKPPADPRMDTNEHK